MALNHYSNNIFARVTVVLLLMENADGSPCTVLEEYQHEKDIIRYSNRS